MRGTLSTLLILLCLAVASGSFYQDACAVPCADEAPGRDCSPDCAFCGCCVSARAAIVELERVVSPLLVKGDLGEEPRSLPAPPLVREILHVPRAA
jgi:hypothetical protein